MNRLGNGLSEAKQYEDALSVRESQLSLMRRVDADEDDLLVAKSNLAVTYHELGRLEEALPLRRDVYYGTLQLFGEEHEETLTEASNYAVSLITVQRFEEAKSVLRKTIPVARRVLRENDTLPLRMRRNYAKALYKDDGATLDDLREAVATLEELVPTARRVLGGAHPITLAIERRLRGARAALRARETPPPLSLSEIEVDMLSLLLDD